MAAGCVKTRWHPNAAPKPMQRRMKNMTRFPYQFNCLCGKIALDIVKLRQEPRSCCKWSHSAKALLANEPANEWTPIFALLLFASLSHLDSFFPSVRFWEIFPSARLCMFQLSSFKVLEWFLPMIPFSGNRHLKNSSNRTLIFRISSRHLFEYLCQSTQRRLSCNTFFCDAYLWSSIWSSTVEISFKILRTQNLRDSLSTCSGASLSSLP